MLIELDLSTDHEKSVMSALDAAAKNLGCENARDGRWTLEIKKQLRDKQPPDCETRATNCDSAEFLYDLIWIKPDREKKFISNLVVALECEWSMGGEPYDFQKLLLARADTRVMVFQGKQRQRQCLIDQMLEEIDHFEKTRDDDRYLFACWDRDPPPGKRSFLYELHVVRKPGIS
jgi:hypothetical protein